MKHDLGALAFCAICAGLALPMLFPAQQMVAVCGCLPLLGLAFAWRAFVTRQFLPRTLTGWANLLTLLLLPLGLWATPDRDASWIAVCKVVAGLALFYGVAGLARTRWLSYLPWALLPASAALALLVLVGARWAGYIKVPWFPRWIYDLLPHVQLPVGAVGADQINANVGSATMALLLPPAVALALWGERRGLRLAAGVTALLVLGVLILAQGRLSWVAAALILPALPLIRARRWKLLGVSAAGLAVIAALGFALVLGTGRPGPLAPLAPALGMSVDSLRTAGGRVGMWKSALAMVRDYPLTGVGPGMFERVATVRYPLPERKFHHAHNIFLQIAAEYGIAAALAHAALLAGLAWGLARVLRRGKGPPAALPVGLAGSLFVYFFLHMTDAPSVSPYVYAICFALFGAMAAVSPHEDL